MYIYIYIYLVPWFKFCNHLLATHSTGNVCTEPPFFIGGWVGGWVGGWCKSYPILLDYLIFFIYIYREYNHFSSMGDN